MTMWDRLRKEHPELIGDQFPGGVALCPEDLGYEDKSPCICLKNYNEKDASAACRKCWGREPEGESPQPLRDSAPCRGAEKEGD